jgi:hypothetical protein
MSQENVEILMRFGAEFNERGWEAQTLTSSSPSHLSSLERGSFGASTR